MSKIPKFDTPSPFELWLDLDGVFADFDGRFYKMAGKWPHEVSKSFLWSIVNSVDDFFYKLEMHSDAEHLWEYTKQYNPKFLTGLPMKFNGRQQKQSWVAEKFGPQWETIVLPKREKQLYSGPHKVLLDDTAVNIEQWVKKGGHGILHYDVWDSIEKLEEFRRSYE